MQEMPYAISVLQGEVSLSLRGILVCLIFFFLVLPVVPHLIRLIIPAQLISNSISTSGISQRETTGREKQRTMSDRGPNLNGDVSSVKSASK